MGALKAFMGVTALLWIFRIPIFLLVFVLLAWGGLNYTSGALKATGNRAAEAVGAQPWFVTPPRSRRERIEAVRASNQSSSGRIESYDVRRVSWIVFDYRGTLRNTSNWTFTDIHVECRYGGEAKRTIEKTFPLPQALVPGGSVSFSVSMESDEMDQGKAFVGATRCYVSDLFMEYRETL